MLANVLNAVTHQRVLLSPLNWGLGHVTRTIPVIRQLLKQGNEVFVCCDEPQERFYRNYFPNLWYIPHSGYPFEFGGKGRWLFDISKQLAALNAFRKQELRTLNQYVNEFNPDLIISDQRFGFRHTSVRSCIISHQLNLPLPLWAKLANFFNQQQLNQFDEIWLPDIEGSILSGELSQMPSEKVKYIGWLSRFKYPGVTNGFKEFSHLGVVSGPDPYAKQLYDTLISEFSKLESRTVIIAPSKHITGSARQFGNCSIHPNPSPESMEQLFSSSETVVSRSGYSTLMDLTVMQNNALLIPTPGQLEQLYLAKKHVQHEKWKFTTQLNKKNLEGFKSL